MKLCLTVLPLFYNLVAQNNLRKNPVNCCHTGLDWRRRFCVIGEACCDLMKLPQESWWVVRILKIGDLVSGSGWPEVLYGVLQILIAIDKYG